MKEKEALSVAKEQELIDQYKPFIEGIAKSCCREQDTSAYDTDDLISETTVAFLTELRKLDNLDDIVKKKTDIRKAVIRFLIRNNTVAVPYGSYYQIEGARAENYTTTSLEVMLYENEDAFGASDDPLDDVLTGMLEDQVMDGLTREHKVILSLMKAGYNRQDIGKKTGLSDRQLRRRIEQIQDAFKGACASW